MTNSDRVAGRAGMIIQGIAAVAALNVDYFIARETTTVTVCTGKDANGDSHNLLTLQNWGSLIAGDECIPPPGIIIIAITTTAGSIKRF